MCDASDVGWPLVQTLVVVCLVSPPICPVAVSEVLHDHTDYVRADHLRLSRYLRVIPDGFPVGPEADEFYTGHVKSPPGC